MKRKGLLLPTLLYDVKQGIVHRWRWYWIPVLLFTICWLSFYIQIVKPIYGAEKQLSNTTVADSLLYLFRGDPGFDARSDENHFLLPTRWMCIFVGSLICSIEYVGTDLDSYMQQILVRRGGRRFWWISKFIWVCLSTILYCLLGYAAVMICSSIRSLSFSLSTSKIMTEIIIGSDRLKDFQAQNVVNNIILLFGIPLLFMLCLNIVQLCVSLFVGKQFSLLLCVTILILSSYFHSPVFFGSYAMVIRSNLFVQNGMQPTEGIIIYFSIILVCFFFGQWRIDTLDFLQVPRNGEV